MSAEAVHYNMHDAKTHLSRIIERVEHGEEIIIDRAGTPVAKVVPWSGGPTAPPSAPRRATGPLRRLGLTETNAEIAADFGIGA